MTSAHNPDSQPGDIELTVDPPQLDVRNTLSLRRAVIRFPVTTLDLVSVIAGRTGLKLLRIVLALVYFWFGILKVTGHSEVFDLIGATLPFLNPHVFVPLLGCVEILLAAGLLSGRLQRVVLLGVVGHLLGTFLTFFDASGFMFRRADPFLLTVDGEFVLKNLVLISAAIVLIGVTARPAATAAVNAPRGHINGPPPVSGTRQPVRPSIGRSASRKYYASDGQRFDG